MQSVSELTDLYNQHFNPRQYVETYYSSESAFKEDNLREPMKELHKIFSSGTVKGDTLLEFGMSPLVHQLLPACEKFKEIIITNISEDGVQELKKWLNDEPGAIDWSAAVKGMCELEGKGESWQDKQKKLRRTVVQILKCDFAKSNPLTPTVLPPVDCVLSTYPLGCMYLDKTTYCLGLRNISSLLKKGGHLVLLEYLGGTYYTVNKVKMPYLCTDVESITEALREAGYVIEKTVLIPRTENTLFDTADSTGMGIFVACKEREVQ